MSVFAASTALLCAYRAAQPPDFRIFEPALR